MQLTYKILKTDAKWKITQRMGGKKAGSASIDILTGNQGFIRPVSTVLQLRSITTLDYTMPVKYSLKQAPCEWFHNNFRSKNGFLTAKLLYFIAFLPILKSRLGQNNFSLYLKNAKTLEK